MFSTVSCEPQASAPMTTMQTRASCLAATRSGALGAVLASTALLCSFALYAQDNSPRRIGKHLEIAEALLAEVAPENTSYRHKNNVVKRKSTDEAACCHADCSGLINWLLLESEARPPAALELWLKSKRPVARHYHDAIVAEKYFLRVHELKHCYPGDVIAVKYPKDNENTGHVMLVVEKPKKRMPTAPIIAGAEQWEVVVIDCSTSPHSADTRSVKGGENHTGLGRGTFRIYADAQGGPIGYSWSLGARSEYRPATDRPLVIGRFRPNGNESGDSVKKVTANPLPPGVIVDRTD